METTKITNEIIFQTSDIALAAYLKIKGYKLGSTTQDNGGKIIFGFIDSNQEQREKDVFAFFNNEGEFLSYMNAWKDLKFFLHRNKDEK